MDKKIEVYSTPTCPYCDKVKKFLDKNNIDYEDYNVAQNTEKAKEMVQKTGQKGVPVTQIGEETVIGYNKKKLKELLDL